jgi:hypothetical protein
MNGGDVPHVMEARGAKVTVTGPVAPGRFFAAGRQPNTMISYE